MKYDIATEKCASDKDAAQGVWTKWNLKCNYHPPPEIETTSTPDAPSKVTAKVTSIALD